MTQSHLSNRDLRDDIRDYWSDRATTFDDDPGHTIPEGSETAAWERLFRRHLGPARGRRVLDLASGTGEIARLCTGLGFHVTGLDWSEQMLGRARAKLPGVAFIQADAERTMLPDDNVDVIVTRHLVWTLVDPAAAFAEWRRILSPGGQLLLVDGDFVTRGWVARTMSRLFSPKKPAADPRHRDILQRVHFSQGARAPQVAAMLADAGFSDIRVDTGLGPIHRAQAAQLGWRKALLRHAEHRYAISARKGPRPRDIG